MSTNERTVQLARFDNSWYSPGRSKIIQSLWFLVGLPLLRCAALPSSGFRRTLLRCFGAHIGNGVVIKPGVRVKYPWRLWVGDDTWIGEDCWIDNLADVMIGSNVCLSQGVYFCTGNHDWSDPRFGLRLGSIVVEDGAWVAARATLAPGVRIGRNAVISLGMVVTASADSDIIHSEQPIVQMKGRAIRPSAD